MTNLTDIAERPRREKTVESTSAPVPSGSAKTIWIDLDNSPHVPFFLPIVEELRKRGHKVILTARNSYQVIELMKLHRVSCPVVGRHWGKNRAAKILGTSLRALQLARTIAGQKVDLAISHVSRSQLLGGVLLGIPILTISDYEFIAKTGAFRSDWVFTPQYIPPAVALQPKKGLMQYPGLKEDVYVPQFRPDAAFRKQLGFSESELVVTVRPPATEAHYHNEDGDVLLDETLRLLTETPNARVVLLPRNERQEKALRKQWGSWIENRKIVVPEHAIDGLNLVWASDLVISGGGTMNREAAALGVPVYSIFRGQIGGVDRYLAGAGRLIMIETVEDLRAKLILKPRKRNELHLTRDSATLAVIVDGICSIVEHQRLPAHV